MRPIHLLWAIFITAIWGFNFVVIKVGLGSFPPLLLTALRFSFAAVPALFLERPAVPWRHLILTGSALFVGQYVLLFVAMSQGMPPGLASITLQVQVCFTMLLAVVTLGERPQLRQWAGAAVAFAGLAAIGSTVGGDVTSLGLGLTTLSALSWAGGNLLLKRMPKPQDGRPVKMLNLIVWLSLVPPLPCFALSLGFEGPARILDALANAGWVGFGSLFYIVALSTLVGFGIWGRLLSLYSASTVVPFSLLVPIFGAASAALVFHESFGPARLAGMALIMSGLAVASFPIGWLRLKRQAV
ncbi:MAG TPA: EamA family transporter [Aliidongia sp.]|uniref:EamA family transporter n=1 Tax=Aliidongia sp. TaxID=1914230 RepID=UPI002DDD5F88|nr:EamA family transporter [Aliidongia sp.]HEV2677591.1 EamA family transporter [Aliidongia sp.]